MTDEDTEILKDAVKMTEVAQTAALVDGLEECLDSLELACLELASTANKCRRNIQGYTLAEVAYELAKFFMHYNKVVSLALSSKERAEDFESVLLSEAERQRLDLEEEE